MKRRSGIRFFFLFGTEVRNEYTKPQIEGGTAVSDELQKSLLYCVDRKLQLYDHQRTNFSQLRLVIYYIRLFSHSAAYYVGETRSRM